MLFPMEESGAVKNRVTWLQSTPHGGGVQKEAPIGPVHAEFGCSVSEWLGNRRLRNSKIDAAQFGDGRSGRTKSTKML